MQALAILLWMQALVPAATAQVPSIINYQGRVVVNGTNFTGNGQFKFALVDGSGATTFWSNDGTTSGEPAASVSVPVNKGLYSVLLGAAPMVPISPAVFTNADVRLRVWFDSGSGMQQLSPDQRIGAVGYAMVAAAVDASGPLRWGNANELNTDQGGSIELGDSALSGTVPFIDFHYGIGGNQDYNVRLINDADQHLSCAGDFAALSLSAGGLYALRTGNVGIGTSNPQRALQLEREMLIRGNDDGGAEYTDWPYASLSIRRSDNFAENGVSMLSFGFRNDPLYATDDAVASIRLFDPQQAPNAPASSGTTQLRIGSPGPVVLQTGGGKVGIGVTSPAEELDVAGAVRLGTTTNPTPSAGTIRWTGTDFEGYDGSIWISLTAAAAPAGMVLVPGGSFTMGSAAVGGDSVPEHPVTLTSFYLEKQEVTYLLWYDVRQWAANNGYSFQNPGREGDDGTDGAAPTVAASEPVTRVSWRDAVVWCNARSEKEGLAPVYTYSNVVIRSSSDTNATACDHAIFIRDNNGYRLPTEAEWEYAARYAKTSGWTPGDWASGASAVYSNASASDEVAWYALNSGSHSHAVGTKKANQLGVSDMSGNVSEWCWDWYESYYVGAVTNPVGPSTGWVRTGRGDNWAGPAVYLQGAIRNGEYPYNGWNQLGFRCARSGR